jgi:O-succinylhomoserine sulfhydrylase
MTPRRFETNAVRTQVAKSQHDEHSVPLYLTSSFVFDDAEEMRASFADEKQRNIYSRFTNPNTNEFVEKICQMEGAPDGCAFATGMAAVFGTFAALLNSGDHILSARAVFGSTHGLFTKFFPKWNIETTYFDIEDLDNFDALVTPNTKMIYAESPTNPGLQILDLERLGALAKKYNLILVIDNCFATPYLQQPIAFGADLVIHSATKLMDGQGRVLGGVTVGRTDLIQEINAFARTTGPAMSPFNAWTLSKSLETLSIRVDRHCDNAEKITTFLLQHQAVEVVRYPFHKDHPQYDIAKKQMKRGGNIITIQVKGGIEGGKKFMNGVKMCSRSSNLGDSRTIVTQPAISTHSKLSKADRLAVNITDGLVRISVGLEHPDDIIQDLKQALDNLK